MLPTHRAFTANEPLAKHWLVQDASKDLLALLEDFVAMGDEEQSFVAGLAETLVVECRNPRLSRAGRRDDEVAEMSTLAFKRERGQDLNLERFGLDVNAESKGRRDRAF